MNTSKRAGARRWAWLLLAAVLVVALGSFGVQRWRHHQGPPDPAPSELHPWFGPRSAEEAIARADVEITGQSSLIAQGHKDWLRLEMLGVAHLGRFRLTGSYTDLVGADRALAEAIALAEAPGGPNLSRASELIALHRLAQAEAVLARFDRLPGPAESDLSAAEAMRGDIAFQRGDYRAARDAYARAELSENNAGLALRQAALALHTGDPELARRRVNAVLRGDRLTRHVLATTALQRATIAYAVGDWDTAGHWIAAANKLFPGFWLGEAMAAQDLALRGKADEAARRYAELAQRTNAPEVMDALAHLLRLEGRGAESRGWANRAGAVWNRRLAALPEAAVAHVVEHELAVGNPRRALALARGDAVARPHGATLALLARAQFLAGDAAGALASADKAIDGGWRSSTLLLVKADALDALGRGSEAGRVRDKARALNPRATDPAARFLWFGHD